MKLLFDAMLSPRLTSKLADLYPDSRHVEEFGIEGSDTAIWDFAHRESFTIVTKDNDFNWRAEVMGPPPKVVRLRIGNCHSRLVEALMRMSFADVTDFIENPQLALLVLPLVDAS